MKKIILIIVLATLCLFFSAVAQDNVSNIKPLKIGDQVPDITINNIINYKDTNGKPATTAKISDFNNKLLIINFWSTSCGSCVNALPKVEALQREYSGQFQILSVSYEKEKQVEKFLTSNPTGKKFTGSIVTDDTLLKKTFAYQFLPHIVVVKNGIYLQSWPEDYLTSANVRALLFNTDLKLTQKIDVLNFNYTKPIFDTQAHQGLTYGQPMYYSAFGGSIYGLPHKAGIVTDSLHNFSRYYLINHTALHMYGIALNSSLPLTPNRRILEVKNQDAFVYEKRSGYLTDWRKNNCYSYERLYPSNVGEIQIANQFKNDLDLYLNTNGRIEERKVTCLELRIKHPSKLNSAYTNKDIVKDNNGNYLYLHSINTDDLVYILNEQSEAVPILDGTVLNQAFDLDFDNPPTNIKDWQSALRPFGIELKQVQKQLTMFVLSDRASVLPNRKP